VIFWQIPFYFTKNLWIVLIWSKLENLYFYFEKYCKFKQGTRIRCLNNKKILILFSLFFLFSYFMCC
jgi:hypothetical protein